MYFVIKLIKGCLGVQYKLFKNDYIFYPSSVVLFFYMPMTLFVVYGRPKVYEF